MFGFWEAQTNRRHTKERLSGGSIASQGLSTVVSRADASPDSRSFCFFKKLTIIYFKEKIMPKLPPISCSNFKPLSKNSNLKGFFEVEILTGFGPLIFRDFRFIQQDGQKGFVSPPQKTFEAHDGTTKYVSLVELPKEWKEEILKKVLPLIPAPVTVSPAINSASLSEEIPF